MAASQFEWLERQPSDDHLAAAALRFRRGLTGDRKAARGHGPRLGGLRVLHDRFLESLRPTRRFQELMASAQERYARFTDDGAPTLTQM